MKLIAPYDYKGWRVTNPGYPVTGQFRATRFGVGMGANSQAMIERMIDKKVEEYNETTRP